MELTIHVDSACSPNELRAIAATLLTLAGDVPLGQLSAVAAYDPPTPPPPPPPSLASVTAAAPAPASVPAATDAPPPPPLELQQSAAPPAPADAPPAPVAYQYDSAGMPWDTRIHQKGKSKKKDGTWKVQKNIPASVVQEVTQELALKRLQRVAPSTTAMPDAPPAPPAAGGATLTAPSAPGPFNVNTAFRDFMTKVIALTGAGKVTGQIVSQIAQQNGAPNLQSLQKTPELIPNIEAGIDLYVLTTAGV